jgi:hypothetical protein
MFYCEKNNPHRLCNVLAESAMKTKCKLARRPFNRFEPETTSWWLVPSSALPFYQFKKIYCSWANKERDAMLCGLYLEKGLAPELASVYPSRKGRSLLMNKKWYWQKFIESCDDGSLSEKIKTAAQTSGFKLEFHITGGYVDDPALFDPYAGKQKKDHYIFELDKDLSTLNYRSAKRDTMILKCLNKVHNVSDLCSTMQVLDKEHFLWLDFFIAAEFKVATSDTEESEITSPDEIWNNFLNILMK